MTQELSMEQIRARLAGLQLYAVFMRPTGKYNTQSEEGRELMRKHLQFQLDMEDRGVLLAAGPLDGAGQASSLSAFRTITDERASPIIDASGMYMVVAHSREAAEGIASLEPFEAAGWRTHTLCTWQLNEGTAIPVVKAMLAAMADSDADAAQQKAGQSQ
jgi:uncharacterized protein YciI